MKPHEIDQSHCINRIESNLDPMCIGFITKNSEMVLIVPFSVVLMLTLMFYPYLSQFYSCQWVWAISLKDL